MSGSEYAGEGIGAMSLREDCQGGGHTEGMSPVCSVSKMINALLFNIHSQA